VHSPSINVKRSFIVTLGLLTGMAALSVDISLPAIPSMVDALLTTFPRGQQIVGIFIAGMAAGQIPAGLFSDRLGRLPVLYAGMLLFAVAAAVAASASNIDVMLAARFLQGSGASATIVLSRAIVRDIAHGKEAARLMSLMTMIFTAIPVIAPSIGALLVTYLEWRAPFVLIAALGFVILFAIRNNLVETHTPESGQHPVRQLVSSFREFFSHRQSIFGLLLFILPPWGFLSIITVSAALIVETYGVPLQVFGLIFAVAGLSILVGAAVNRILVARFDMMHVLAMAIVLFGITGAQFLLMVWLDNAPLPWLWGNICVFFFSVAILMPNASVIALDPMPRIAGVASSIMGTIQNSVGASSAIIGAAIYDGSVRNSIVITASSAALIVIVFLLKPVIAPGPLHHHPDELARD
jgi:DHA1 family bicyclomycin/chloramphenicol resistance-like MFS transporter